MRRHDGVEQAIVARRMKQLRRLRIDDRRPASAYRKSHALGCVHSCVYCRHDKIYDIPTARERREWGRYRESLAELARFSPS
jgi:DNA repair photolyase